MATQELIAVMTASELRRVLQATVVLLDASQQRMYRLERVAESRRVRLKIFQRFFKLPQGLLACAGMTKK